MTIANENIYFNQFVHHLIAPFVLKRIQFNQFLPLVIVYPTAPLGTFSNVSICLSLETFTDSPRLDYRHSIIRTDIFRHNPSGPSGGPITNP